MFEFLKKYNGDIYINNKYIDNNASIDEIENTPGTYEIVLKPYDDDYKYLNDFIFTVRPSMTNTNPEDPYDFNKLYNNGVCMPMRTMQGDVIKITKTLFYAKLHGVPVNSRRCSYCGKLITSPESIKYGVGTECIKKLGLKEPQTSLQWQEYKKKIEEQLYKVTWEGWIPKDCIVSME